MSNEDIDDLNALRDKWAERAALIDKIYGDDSPEARAIRMCISDVHAFIHRFETA